MRHFENFIRLFSIANANLIDIILNFIYVHSGAYRVGDIYIPPPIKAHCSNESKGSRLIITQITNNNFKSYAGEVALGPFCHVRMQSIADS